MTKREFVAKILAATQDDTAIVAWTERIAQLANSARIPVSEIDWTGSPSKVAGNLVDYLLRTSGYEQEFLEILEKMLPKRQ